MTLNYFFKWIGRIFFSLLILTTTLMANEEPDYIVLKKESEIEIRQYKNFLTASIEMEGDRKEAIGKGFRSLFKYISGENKNKENISMTIPVMQKSSGNNKWKNYIKEKGIKIEEPAIYAGYNAPWTPWFLKRNEVMFKLAG
ncbi:MAG: heme-binding protein [Candidatus Fonsibacter ubiquis]|nr:heme-binding protein [Candidatus Fonsibacter ubiquis]